MDIEEPEADVSVIAMTRRQLHWFIKEPPERLFDRKFKYLDNKIVQITKCSSEQLSEIRKILNSFKIVYKRKWFLCNHTEARFLKKNEEWLNTEVLLPATRTSTCSPGRPNKEFAESSARSKHRKTVELRKNVPADELTHAAQMSQRAAGNTDMAKVIQDITKSPSRATKFRKAVASSSKQTKTRKHSPSEALAIFVEADLTRSQYAVIQQANKTVYPCYSLLQKAKQECYPRQAITVTETSAEVKLQELLNHTAERLYKYIKEVIVTCTNEEKKNLKLISKWGCDGSQQAQYKQKFENEGESDADIFQSSLVPLRLSSGQKTVWQNPLPSSPRYCRPIRIRFIKENNKVTNEEIKYVEDQIKALQKTKFEEDNVEIKHVLLLTMIDGKVCNAATDTSSTMRCYICGKTSKQFNDLTQDKPENPETFKYGLSILHARIRLFEFILHLSYKIKAKVIKSRVTLEADKIKISGAKRGIQDAFREQLGLLVDMPKAGFGNTNDGNTSRRFFDDPKKTAALTGVDEVLIARLKVILEVLSSGFEIDVEKFSKYAIDTAKLYVNKYKWQPMSPTLHKILIHAPSVVSYALLPIGQLSEEAAEARNKHFRQYRQDYSRKFSRTDCNRDVLNRLLLTSDPFLTSMKPKSTKKKMSFSKDAIEMFKEGKFTPSADINEDEEELEEQYIN